MSLAKAGTIQYVCEPNALMTLMEFALDYGDEELYKKAHETINRETENIKREDIKELLKSNLEKLKNGERDLFI